MVVEEEDCEEEAEEEEKENTLRFIKRSLRAFHSRMQASGCRGAQMWEGAQSEILEELSV